MRGRRHLVRVVVGMAVLALAPERAPRAADPEVVETIRQPEVDCTVVNETGYRRGKARKIDVIAIDGRQIEIGTANAFWAMRDAAAAEGIELTIFSAFRTNLEQKYFYACYTSCACNSCAPAAKPGFSNHQSGHAIDIAMWPGVHDWLVANAGRFGFVATVRSEPWHWEYRPKKRMRWPALCRDV